MVFSASPDAPPTHQRQLLLNFPKSIRMAAGDTLSGTIRWYPSQEDLRAVQVDVQVRGDVGKAGVKEGVGKV